MERRSRNGQRVISLSGSPPGQTIYYLERVLQDAACLLIKTPDESVDDVVRAILGCAATAARGERAFLFQRVGSGNEFRLSHVWAAAHARGVPEPSWCEDDDRMPFATEMVRRAEAFELQAGRGQLPESSGELDALRRKGLRSVLAIPIQHESETTALIGLSTVTYDRSWNHTEISLLRAIGAVLVSGLLRARRATEVAHKDRTIRTMLDATSEIAILTDQDAVILHTNEAFARILDTTPEALVGQSSIDIAPPETHQTRRRVFQSVVRTRKTAEADIDVDDRIFSMVLSPVINDENRVTQVAIFGRDVTAQRAAEQRRSEYEQRLRELANEITLAEERLRQVLATELHDQVTQPLVALRLKLAALDLDQPSSGVQLHELSQLLRDAISATETVTREMASPTLCEQGLPAALESLTQAFMHRYDIDVHLRVEGARQRLPQEASVLLYHAAREFLANIIKHARARTVSIFLRFKPDGVTLTVEDDGVGLKGETEAAGTSKDGGFGLFILRERLRLLSGSLQLSERSGGGTRVVAALMLPGKGVQEEVMEP